MQNSNVIIAETTLEGILQKNYDLSGPIHCKFIRRSFNDHYIIETASMQFILRVYINNKNYIKCMNEIHFELDLLEYLSLHKQPVIPPIKNNSNQNLSILKLQNETRYLVLFPYAKGSPINEDLQVNQSLALGEILANLHCLSNKFTSEFSRQSLDLTRLIEQPLDTIRQYGRLFGFGDLSFVEDYSHVLIDGIKQLPLDEHTYGVIHGDPNPSNLYFSNNEGFSLFDFDHCGFGYRIHDLAVVRLSFPEEVYEKVVKGYEQVRSLNSIERDFIKSYADILLIKKFSDIYDMLEITGADEEEKRIITKNAYHTLRTLKS